MTKKVWTLLAVAAVLGGFSLYLNKDWFVRDNIQIFYRSRPARGFLRRITPETAAVDPLLFFFNRTIRLTSVKVIPVFDIQTNKSPQPVWHLVSDSNSVPIKNFTYGTPIQGMKPALNGSAPDPLLPGLQYRVFIEAGSEKAQRDFVPVPRTQ
jgi:hypothetical protein